MTLRNPLIKIGKYVTQWGQLYNYGGERDRFGDVRTIVTTVRTIPCLVYQEKSEQDQTNPAITLKILHRAVIPTSVTSVVEHDHLKEVRDQYGNLVLEAARVGQRVDYHHWRHEPRFFVVNLDLDLSN